MGNKIISVVFEIFSEIHKIHHSKIVAITDSPEKIGDIPAKLMSYQEKKLSTYISELKKQQFYNKRYISNSAGISTEELKIICSFHLSLQYHIDRASDILQKSIERALPSKKYFKSEMRNGFKIVYAWDGPFSLN